VLDTDIAFLFQMADCASAGYSEKKVPDLALIAELQHLVFSKWFYNSTESWPF